MPGTPSGWIDTSRPEVVKLFETQVWGEWRHGDPLFDPKNGLIGSGEDDDPDFMGVELDRASKEPGDSITVDYDFELEDSPGAVGNEVLEGKEDEQSLSTFTIDIDKQRIGVRVDGEIVEQRIAFNTYQRGKYRLSNKFRNRRSVIAWNHLCGNPQTDTHYTGQNAIQTVDADHFFRPASHATDEDVQGDVTATFDLELIDELVTIGEMSTPPMLPARFGGSRYFHMWLHTDAAADLRDVNSTWFDIQKAQLQGGKIDDNPLGNRYLGKWRDTLLWSHPYITQGVHSTTGKQLANTRRNVFCGANSFAVAYGRMSGYRDRHFKFFTGAWDHGDKWYCSAKLCWGVKAVQVDVDGTSTSVGRIVVPTYARERKTTGNLHQPAL